MENYLLGIAVSVLLTALKDSVKNAAHKATLKSIALKIYTQIGVVYADDPDFANVGVNSGTAQTAITK